MPTYAYACTACDHRFDAQQSFSDPALTECPECGQRLRKVFGSVGVVFKGSGFYRTDSRASTPGGSRSSSGSTSSSNGSSSSSSSNGSSSSGSGSTGSSTATTSGSSSVTTPAAAAG